MVNAWSLAWEEMNGTMDETYPVREDVPPDLWNKPIVKKDYSYYDKHEGLHLRQDDFKVEGDDYEHSPYWYDYNRNDPDRKNPFTDAFDYMMAESVVSGDDGYPSEFTTLSDNDDQIAHHIGLNNEDQKSETMENIREASERKRDGRYKYHEAEIIQEIEDYVSSTYNGHYTGTKHEYRNVQTIDLMASRDLAAAFCQSNILKYGSRYGSKDGRNKGDLLKVIHYAMLLLHFDEHYGKPSMTSGNIDHNMP